MPIDLEMLISAANSPFHNYSIDGRTYSDNTYDRSLSFPKHCVPRSYAKYQNLLDKEPPKDVFGKKTSLGTVFYKPTNAVCRGERYSVRKKKVSFADDKGLKLVEVCEIPGAPKWADDVLTLLIGNAKRSVVKEKKWKIAFQHPPWPDEKLKEVIEENNVALEHISVDEDDTLLGCVKVKNLAFEKHVFLRVTFDRWQSYIDIPCTYADSSEQTSNLDEYDTFCFSSKISHAASRYEVIEFCVGFQCDGKEYWDNNSGINYRLIVEYSMTNVTDWEQDFP